MYHFDAKTLIKNITVLKFFFLYMATSING